MIYTLQGVRALAMIGIFLFHSGLLLNGTFPVTLFFILSGFVAYYTKYESIETYTFKKSISWIGNKMIPLYIVHLITFGMSIIIKWDWIVSLDVFDLLRKGILNLLLIQSLFSRDVFGFNNLSWFLSVTFLLYLISIPCIKLVKRFNSKIIILICVVILIFQYSLNIINTSGIEDLYLYSNPFYRLFDFVLGMLVAKLYLNSKSYNKLNNKRVNIYEIGLVGIFIIMYVMSFIINTGCSYYSLLFMAMLYVFSYGQGIISKILEWSVLQKLAKISFEFYMVHELILIIFRKVFLNLEVHWLIKNVIICIPSFIISLGLAILINLYVTKKVKTKK